MDHRIIPASRRPDGTLRKERKIRDGYVPPEEIPRYSHPNASTSQDLSIVDRVVIPSNKIAQPSFTPVFNSTLASGSKSSKKNEKRSQKRREKHWLACDNDNNDNDENDDKITLSTDDNDTVSNGNNLDSKSCSAPAPTRIILLSSPSTTETTEQNLPETSEKEKQKQIKAVQKKLRQIEDLKVSKANGKQLNPDQLDKLAREQDLISSLNLLSL